MLNPYDLPPSLRLPPLRTCSLCGETKPLDAQHFTENRAHYAWAASRFHPYCTACQVAKTTAWAAANPEKRRETYRRYRARQKANALGHIPQAVHDAEAARLAEVKRRKELKALNKKLLKRVGAGVSPWRKAAEAAAQDRLKAAGGEALRRVESGEFPDDHIADPFATERPDFTQGLEALRAFHARQRTHTPE